MKLFRRTRRKKGPKIRPGWKEVLLAIYSKPTGAGSGRGKRRADFSFKDALKYTKNPWFKKLKKILKISGKKGLTELIHHLNFLQDQELIYPINKHTNWPRLTKTGFSVAVKIEGEKSAAMTQELLVIVTLLIAVTGAFQFFNATGVYNPSHLFLAYVGMLTFIAVSIRRMGKKMGP